MDASYRDRADLGHVVLTRTSTRIRYGDRDPKEERVEHMHANSGTSILGTRANGGSACDRLWL